MWNLKNVVKVTYLQNRNKLRYRKQTHGYQRERYRGIVRSLGLKYMHYYMKNGRRQWQPTPVILPGKSHGRRSLVGYSPWGLKELGMTERLHFHFSLEKEMATHSSILVWKVPGMGAW